nr:hypothetical protein CFP56_19613 [Quercus suber]
MSSQADMEQKFQAIYRERVEEVTAESLAKTGYYAASECEHDVKTLSKLESAEYFRALPLHTARRCREALIHLLKFHRRFQFETARYNAEPTERELEVKEQELASFEAADDHGNTSDGGPSQRKIVSAQVEDLRAAVRPHYKEVDAIDDKITELVLLLGGVYRDWGYSSRSS